MLLLLFLLHFSYSFFFKHDALLCLLQNCCIGIAVACFHVRFSYIWEKDLEGQLAVEMKISLFTQV